MNIALFPSAFYPSLGGVEELTRQLALELQRQDHRVIVVTNRWPRNLPEFERIDGLEVYRLPLRTPDAGIKSEISYRLTCGRIEAEIAALVRSFRADVIHVQCVGPGARYAMEASRQTGVPIVVTLQGELTMDATKLFQRSAFARDVLADAMRNATLVTACSGKTLSDGLEFVGGVVNTPTRIVFNGARVSDFSQAIPTRRARPFILALGRLVTQKGFDTLLRALPKCLPSQWELVLAGEGDQAQPLRQLAEQTGLGDRIVFYGRADRESVPALMKGCEFVVVPSRADEGLPVVCAEALAAGKPIVATTMGGIPEAVVDGKSGLLVPPEDENALAHAIAILAGNEALRRSMGEHAAERAKLFEWLKIAGEYLSCYQQAAKDKPALIEAHESLDLVANAS